MWLGLLTIVVSSLIGGSVNTVAVKLGVREFPPLTFTSIRFILATFLLLPLFLSHTKQKLFKKDIIALSLGSIFFVVNMGVFSIALQFTTAIMGQLLYVLCPIVVIVLAHFLIGEKFTKQKVIGLAIALSGVIFLIYRSFGKGAVVSFGTPFGNTLILCGVVCFAFYLISVRKLSHTYTPVTITFFNFLVAGILLGICMPVEWLIRPFVFSKITTTGIVALGAIVISSVVAYILQQDSIKRTSAFVGSLSLYIAPFFTALTAVLLIGEKITISFLIGGVLIAIGVFYATAYSHVKGLFKNREILVEN